MPSVIDYLRFDPAAYARLRRQRRAAGSAAAGLAIVDFGLDHAWRIEFERSLRGA